MATYDPDEYRRYLRSRSWKKKRMKRLKKDNFTCQRCGRKTNLQIHHKTYKNIYKEQMEDLVTLCGKCHKKEHGR